MTVGAEILRSFVADAREQLDRIQHQISSFAGAPGDPARLNAALPAVRAIKTASVFLGLRGPGWAADSLERAVRDVCRHAAVAGRRDLLSSLAQHVRQLESSLRELELAGQAAPPAPATPATCPEPDVPPAAVPSREPGEADEPDDADPSAAEAGGRGRILVVADSRFFRHLVAATLERQRYEVETAATLAEAVALFERDEPFDLVVADVALFETSGRDPAERLRGQGQTDRQPWVGLTAPGTPPSDSGAAPGCFDRVLTRFDTRELLATVEELFPPARDEATGDGSLRVA